MTGPMSRRPSTPVLPLLLLWSGAAAPAQFAAGLVETIGVAAPGTSAAASAPSGETLVAWTTPGTIFSPAATVQVTVRGPAGEVVRPPGALALLDPVSGFPCLPAVAAGPSGFFVAWPVAASGSVPSRIRYRILALDGTPVSPEIPLAIVPFLNVSAPSAAARADGSFVLAWACGALSIQVAAISPSGDPLQPLAMAVNDASASPVFCSTPAVAAWPSGRAVVAWTASDFTGSAVHARWLDAALQPAGAVRRVHEETEGDQAGPRVAADGRDGCVIAWTDASFQLPAGSYGGHSIFSRSAEFRRFDHTGMPRDALDRVAAGGTATRHWSAASAAMFPQGGWMLCVHRTDSAGPVFQGAEWRRYAWHGGLLDSVDLGLDLPNAPGTNFGPVLAADPFGHLTAAGVPGQCCSFVGPMAIRRFVRRQVVFSDPSPAPGQAVGIALESAEDAGATYAVALSLGAGPVPVDLRSLRLSPDAVFHLSLDPAAGVCQGGLGTLDSFGLSAAPSVLLPPLPSLSGVTVRAAFAVLALNAPSGIHALSDSASFTIE